MRHRARAGAAARACFFVFLLGGACVAANGASAEVLILHDQTRQLLHQAQFDGKDFVSPDRKVTVHRNEVQDWWVTPSAAETESSTLPQAQGTAGVGVSVAIPELARYRAAAGKMAARYPGCKGVQVLDLGRFQLTRDRRHLYRYHFAGLILSENALEWSRILLGFTEGRSRVRIVQGRTLTPDNRVLELSPAEVAIVRPSGGAVFFDPNSRQVSASLPAAEIGALIDYTYEYETFAPEDWRLFFPGFYFQGDVPVCQSALEVVVPADLKLWFWDENWAAAKSSLPLLWRWLPGFSRRPLRTIETDGGDRYAIYRWRKEDMPPISPEPSMPPWTELVPAVHATIHETWDSLNQLVAGMQNERLQVTPAVKEKTSALIGEVVDPEQQTARIYHWVQKNIRYISVKSSLSSGWSGHPADETLRNGYGDCTDKSILFAAMLQAGGIAAEPVILQTNDAGLFVPKYPMVFGNHCITQVHLPGRSLFLDCTTQDHRYPSLRADDHGVLTLNFLRGERTFVPVPTGMDGKGKRSKERIQVLPDGAIRVSCTNEYGGRYEAGLRASWKQVPEPLRMQVMQQYVNGIAPRARVLSFQLADPENLDKPFVLQYEYTVPGYVFAVGTLGLLQIPEREKSFEEISLEKRRYPIAYPTSELICRDLTVQFPENWRVLSLPAPVDLRGPHASYHESYQSTGTELAISLQYERQSQRVPPQDYAAYRQLLRSIEQATRRPLCLETRAPEPGVPTPTPP